VGFNLGQIPLQPRVSRAGIELVKRFEGLRRKAAALPSGGWTIGYGHTLSAREGAEVSEEEAEALLIYDLRRVAEKVWVSLYTPLNQNQFDALCAFAFNIGVENFAASAVAKRLNEGNYLQAAAAFELWRKAEFDGESLVVDALVRRRAAEKALFLTPPDGFRPAPTPVPRVRLDPSVIEAMETRRPGLANPVLGEAPLDTPLATFEREEDQLSLGLTPPQAPPAPGELPAEEESPALAAAAGLRAKLERLLSETHEAPLAAEPEPDFAEETEPPPPPPAEDHTLSAASSAEASKPPEPPPAAPNWVEDVVGGFGRRVRPVEYSSFPTSTPTPRRIRAPFGWPMLLLGLVGLAMFLGSIVAMLGGKATFPNLCIGLVGIICIAPAAIRFLLNRLELPPGGPGAE
jgi:lysozyme